MKSCFSLLLALTASVAVAASIQLDELPKVVDYQMPELSRSVLNSGAEVDLRIEINEHGYVTNASVKSATDPKLAAPCLKAIRNWRYAPAMKDGAPIAATFVQPLRFGSDNVTSLAVSTAPLKVRHRAAPEIPAALAYLDADITVALQVDTSGRVAEAKIVNSSADELNDLTIDAALQWTFDPAIKNGAEVASTVYVPFHYKGDPSRAPQPEHVVALEDNNELKPTRQISPRLTTELAQLDGEVQIGFTVNELGRVVSTDIVSASNEDLARISAVAVRQWRFKPIVQNGQAVAIHAVQPFVYGSGKVAMAAVDRLPKVRHTVNPKMPEELDGVSCSAQVLFVIDETGKVADVSINQSSHEAFSAPVLEAAKDWVFAPAVRGGKPTSARVVVPFVYSQK